MGPKITLKGMFWAMRGPSRSTTLGRCGSLGPKAKALNQHSKRKHSNWKRNHMRAGNYDHFSCDVVAARDRHTTAHKRPKEQKQQKSKRAKRANRTKRAPKSNQESKRATRHKSTQTADPRHGAAQEQRPNNGNHPRAGKREAPRHGAVQEQRPTDATPPRATKREDPRHGASKS